MKFKGQASLDYLMTYGWAILLIILVAAALFTLGIFNVNQMVGNRAVGFTQVQVSGFRLTNNGSLFVKLTNEVGVPITLRFINSTWVDKANEQSNITETSTLARGKTTSSELLAGAFYNNGTVGDTFTMEMVIGYTDNKYTVDYVQYGTLTGIVQ